MRLDIVSLPPTSKDEAPFLIILSGVKDPEGYADGLNPKTVTKCWGARGFIVLQDELTEVNGWPA